jgi:phosphate-selective porin OprO/OprP
MKRVTGSFFVAVFLFCVWCMPALAADPSAEIDQLKGDVNKLLQRIQDLEKKQAETEKVTTTIQKEEATLKEEKKERVISYYRDGWFLETPDKKFRMNIAGVLHFDTRVFESGGKSPSSFDIRRARYDMRGYLYKGDIEHIFRLQVEMADPIALRNAYWMLKFRPELNVQIGQFKVPSGGADWLTEEAHVNFIEYATERPVAPDFDRGINIHSYFLGQKVQTNLGIVTGTGYDVDNRDGDWDTHKNFFGRLLLVPFKDGANKWLKGLHFAGAYETGLQTLKTVRGERDNSTVNFESKWFRWMQNSIDLDRRTRYGGEFHWLVGPATLSYEFNRVQWEDIQVYNTSGVLQRTFEDDFHADVHQVWVSYFLTGEEKVFEDVFFAWRQPKPKKNFSLKNGTWGAWEVLARYAYYNTSSDLFKGSPNNILEGTNKGFSLTGGLRWIWNPKTRLMIDLNYLKSSEFDRDNKVGIITTRAGGKGASVRDYVDSETALLMRIILTP